MSGAYSIRADDTFLARLRLAAKADGVTLTDYVNSAVEAKMGQGSLLDQPMVPHGTEPLRGGPVAQEGLPPVSATSPMPESVKAAVTTPDICAHPFRDNHNICRVCGHQR
jgi:hypothetical protein